MPVRIEREWHGKRKFPANLRQAWFLEMLWWGLDDLAQRVRRIENAEEARIKEGAPKGFLGEESMWISGEIESEVMNCLIWYSVSLVTFLKLFASAYPRCDDWRKKFEGPVTFRNKVAAHTAYTDAGGDNALTRDLSISMPITWGIDRFSTGGWVFGRGGGLGKDQWEERSCETWHWSLTSTHEELVRVVEENLPPNSARTGN